MGEYRIAVCTSDGLQVDTHFGRCPRFLVLTLDEESGRCLTREYRDAPDRAASSLGHDPTYLARTAALLEGCSYLMASRIGPQPTRVLLRHGISALRITMPVEQAVERLHRYRRAQTRRNTTGR